MRSDALPEQFEYLVLLQPTSPMRRTADIDGAIERCVERGRAGLRERLRDGQEPVLDAPARTRQGIVHPLFPADEIPHRRQDAPAVFALNGAVYVARTDHLKLGGTFLAPGAVGYPMPKERSLDIDTEFDLAIADFLLKDPSWQANQQQQ